MIVPICQLPYTCCKLIESRRIGETFYRITSFNLRDKEARAGNKKKRNSLPPPPPLEESPFRARATKWSFLDFNLFSSSPDSLMFREMSEILLSETPSRTARYYTFTTLAPRDRGICRYTRLPRPSRRMQSRRRQSRGKNVIQPGRAGDRDRVLKTH